MKKLFYILITFVPLTTKAQVTLIPDQYFELRLVNLGIDTDGIINGQILTSDATAVTDLYLNSARINDFTGITDFINVEILNCYYNPVNGDMGPPYGTIDISTMVNLKELDITATHLNTIDVSNNMLLEKITIANEAWGDILIVNDFNELNLSNNPKVNYVNAFNLVNFNLINLRNKTASKMYIDVTNNLNVKNNVCIEVDDHVAATNGTAPYDTWVVDGDYYFSDICALSLEKLVHNNFKIYPNPATHLISVEQKDTKGAILQAVQILDSSGKWIKTINDNFNAIDVSALNKGMYLFVIQTDKGNKTEKIIIE